MYVLAADVQDVMVMSRQREWHRPHKAVLEAVRRPADRRHRPDLDVLHELRPSIVSCDDATDGSRPGSARPHEIAIHGIRCGPATFTAADRFRVSANNRRKVLTSDVAHT